ncbi:hypothetical protein F2Q70_00040665 [Brassica cretica]|uniref:Myb-like domain-containing protein n=1 Tax=Brassica cretica TaxID=69181 RepID=A0A8S9K3Y4_BRACR|nr:hypothetical protein F2Q70_00040665 [Brassica cretica]
MGHLSKHEWVEERFGLSTFSTSLSRIISSTKALLSRFFFLVALIFSTTSSSVAFVGDLSRRLLSLSIPLADETLSTSLYRFLSSVALLFSATSPLVALVGDLSFDDACSCSDQFCMSFNLFVCSIVSLCGSPRRRRTSTLLDDSPPIESEPQLILSKWIGLASGLNRIEEVNALGLVGCDLCIGTTLLLIMSIKMFPSPLSSNRVLPLSLLHHCSFISFLLERALDMDSNPFMQSSNFVELLNSQQSISFGNYEDSSALSSSQVSSLDTDDVGERRERRKWTPTDDIVLIRAKIQWLATSKNQAPSGRELQLTLRQVQSLLAANRGKLVTKWCDLSTAKNDGGSKKRKCDDGADSSSSQATETKRPAGVKAAKARGKKTMAEENALNEFQRMWDIKHNENDMLHVVLFHVSSSCLDSLATLLSQTLLYEFDSCNTQVLGASV